MKFLQEEIEMSERRACKVIEMDRKSFRYRAKPRDTKELLAKVREIAEKHPTYGYRRVHNCLRREGFEMNLKRLRRIYRQERLLLRKLRKRKRHKLIKNLPPERAQRPNDLWRMDFMFDRLQSGGKFKILTIIDQHTRYSPGIFVKNGFPARELMYSLEAAIIESSALFLAFIL